MTYEELLAKIEAPCGEDYDDAEEVYKSALYNVISLHNPNLIHRIFTSSVTLCSHCKYLYPCPTIQDIEKELGE